MKERGNELVKRIKFAWWALSKKKGYMLIEKCERCGSNNIEIGASTVAKRDDGTTDYYAKYFCRKCGATCVCNEIWEDNALIKFNK